MLSLRLRCLFQNSKNLTRSHKSNFHFSRITNVRKEFTLNKLSVLSTQNVSDLKRLFATIVKNNPQKDDQGNEMKIEITERAVNKLLSITSNDQDVNMVLRITVDSGGCHGFQYFYDLTPISSLKEEDVLFENNQAKVVVDTISLGLIKGSKIDFSEELIGSQFKVIENPQAASGCGCGISFEAKI
ncbi:hypothetical protein G9A89_013416 [Geosiphon pyriformis]|nr:hypothetical protein G9A89_013416 [Geosiphon pyriformis]